MNGDQFTQLMLGGCDTVLVENYKKIHLVSVFPVTRYKINSYDRYVRIVGTNVSDFSLETEKPVTQTLHTWIFAIIYALLAYIIAYSNRFVLWILIFLPTFFGALGLTYQALEKHWPGTVFILLLCYLAVLIIVMLAGFRAGQKKRKKTLFRA